MVCDWVWLGKWSETVGRSINPGTDGVLWDGSRSPTSPEGDRSPVRQGGITCGAIDEPRKSSKAIDERVIINRNKNAVFAHFGDKN